MNRLPVVSWREVEKVLNKLGYTFRRQRGSHRIYTCPKAPTITLPRHRTLRVGTLRSIIRQIGLSVEEFNELLQD